MAQTFNFTHALEEQREKIKRAIINLVMVYGGEEYSGLKNTWRRRLSVQHFNLPLKPLMGIVVEGQELTFEKNGNDNLPFEFYNTDTLADLYDRLASQINATLTKTED